jgi:hypothetical protein
VAVITGELSLTLLFIPELVFWLFSMAHEQACAIMSRRAAMLFAGLCFLARVRCAALAHFESCVSSIRIRSRDGGSCDGWRW